MAVDSEQFSCLGGLFVSASITDINHWRAYIPTSVYIWRCSAGSARPLISMLLSRCLDQRGASASCCCKRLSMLTAECPDSCVEKKKEAIESATTHRSDNSRQVHVTGRRPPYPKLECIRLTSDISDQLRQLRHKPKRFFVASSPFVPHHGNTRRQNTRKPRFAYKRRSGSYGMS